MEGVKAFFLSPRLWTSLAAILVGVLFCESIRRATLGLLGRDDIRGKKATNIRFVAGMLKWIVRIFVLIAVLQANGVNVGSLVAGLGLAGIIVGFALQDILKDLIMGTSILWDAFFSVGDVVRYGGVEGRVVAFNAKVTKIEDLETGDVLSIENRNISEILRVSDVVIVLVPAPYEIGAGRMREICRMLCREILKCEYVRSCEFEGTEEFAASQINYQLRIRCKSPERRCEVRRFALGAIQDVYAAQGIAIPYPRLDVHWDR